jgi:hypothetical protein
MSFHSHTIGKSTDEFTLPLLRVRVFPESTFTLLSGEIERYPLSSTLFRNVRCSETIRVELRGFPLNESFFSLFP